MAKIPLIARRSFVYAGRRLQTGAEFGARTQSDARLLIAIGHAEFAPEDAEDDQAADVQIVAVVETPAPAPAAAVVETAAEAAAEVPADPPAQPPAEEPSAEPVAETAPAAAPADGEDVSPRTGKPRRQYRRRDLTAEGSE